METGQIQPKEYLSRKNLEETIQTLIKLIILLILSYPIMLIPYIMTWKGVHKANQKLKILHWYPMIP